MLQERGRKRTSTRKSKLKLRFNHRLDVEINSTIEKLALLIQLKTEKAHKESLKIVDLHDDWGRERKLK